MSQIKTKEELTNINNINKDSKRGSNWVLEKNSNKIDTSDTLAIRKFLYNLSKSVSDSSEALETCDSRTSPDISGKLGKDEKQILDFAESQANLTLLVTFLNLYMSEDYSSEIIYRLGEVKSIVSSSDAVIPNFTDKYNNISTASNFAIELKEDFVGSYNNIKTEKNSFVNMFFPPFKPTNNKSSLKWYKDYLLTKDIDNNEISEFNSAYLVRNVIDSTYRGPSFKNVNDNIMFIQYLFEKVSGIVSTYLTEWDMSVYYQEMSLDDLLENPVSLTYRICDDNISGTNNSNIAYTHGVINCAISTLSNKNVLTWHPENFFLSKYWTPYDSYSYEKNNVKYDTRYNVEASAYFNFNDNSRNLYKQIKNDDYWQGCLSGWDTWNNIPFWQALYTNSTDSFDDLDNILLDETIKTKEALYNTIASYKKELNDDETVEDDSENAMDVTVTDEIDRETSADTSRKSWIKKIIAFFKSKTKKFQEAQDKVTSSTTTNSASSLIDIDKETEENDSDEDNSTYSTADGISRWNPVLFGGPHGQSYSPETVQGYLQEDNVILRNTPRVVAEDKLYKASFSPSSQLASLQNGYGELQSVLVDSIVYDAPSVQLNSKAYKNQQASLEPRKRDHVINKFTSRHDEYIDYGNDGKDKEYHFWFPATRIYYNNVWKSNVPLGINAARAYESKYDWKVSSFWHYLTGTYEDRYWNAGYPRWHHHWHNYNNNIHFIAYKAEYLTINKARVVQKQVYKRVEHDIDNVEWTIAQTPAALINLPSWYTGNQTPKYILRASDDNTRKMFSNGYAVGLSDKEQEIVDKMLVPFGVDKPHELIFPVYAKGKNEIAAFLSMFVQLKFYTSTVRWTDTIITHHKFLWWQWDTYEYVARSASTKVPYLFADWPNHKIIKQVPVISSDGPYFTIDSKFFEEDIAVSNSVTFNEYKRADSISVAYGNNDGTVSLNNCTAVAKGYGVLGQILPVNKNSILNGRRMKNVTTSYTQNSKFQEPNIYAGYQFGGGTVTSKQELVNEKISNALIASYTTLIFKTKNGSTEKLVAVNIASPYKQFYKTAVYQNRMLQNVYNIFEAIDFSSVRNIILSGIDKNKVNCKELYNNEHLLNYDYWLEEAKNLFDDNYKTSQKEFLGSLKKRQMELEGVKNNLISFATNVWSKITIKDLIEANQEIASIKKQLNKRSDNYSSDIEKFIYCYLRVLYYYREYYINKRFNKTDGTFWQLRPYERILKLAKNKILEQNMNCDVNNEISLQDDKYDIVSTVKQNTLTSKIDAVNNNNYLDKDKIKYAFIEVKYYDGEVKMGGVTNDTPYSQNDEELIYVPLREKYAYKPKNGDYKLTSSTVEANNAKCKKVDSGDSLLTEQEIDRTLYGDKLPIITLEWEIDGITSDGEKWAVMSANAIPGYDSDSAIWFDFSDGIDISEITNIDLTNSVQDVYCKVKKGIDVWGIMIPDSKMPPCEYYERKPRIEYIDDYNVPTSTVSLNAAVGFGSENLYPIKQKSKNFDTVIEKTIAGESLIDIGQL